MRIEEIDENFRAAETVAEGQKFYCAHEKPFRLYGAFWDEGAGQYLRMPAKVAEMVSPEVALLNGCTAGARVRFSTDSRKFFLRAKLGIYGNLPHMPMSGARGFVLNELRKGREHWVASLMPQQPEAREFEGVAELAGGRMRDYVLYLPLYEMVYGLELGFEEGARIASGGNYREELPILYYGSSITQGGCASRPDTSYQAIIAKRTGLDYINLGFSGNAKGERAIAEYLAATPCLAFVYDYDFNSPNADEYERTHYALYEIFRKMQPKTPILLVSRPNPERNPERARRKEIIERTFARAKEEGDKNIDYLDGYLLFGNRDRDLCTVDGTHPTDLGFYRMADKIGARILKLLRHCG